MFRLGNRQLQPEIMDDPDLGFAQHKEALRGLERVHGLTGTVKHLWRPVEQLMRERGETKLTIMDVGCGDAVLLRRLWSLARRCGLQLDLVGCDFSARALLLARAASDAERIPIALHEVDVTRQELPVQADVVICSFFLHHFSASQVTRTLEQLSEAAGHLMVVEDLLRSRLGYCLCWLGVHLMSRSPVVHADGPSSVRAAFTLEEIRGLTRDAGLSHASVRKHWPERFLIQCRTGGGADA